MNLPSGTITFLFTDIEGSTKLWEAHPESMGPALARHDTLMRQAIEEYEGYVFKTVGDAFCAAFHTAPDALQAALSAQRALISELWPAPVTLRVRMALHTGTAELRENDYFGQTLNRVARLLLAGHGGQTLLSLPSEELTRDTLPPAVTLHPLGEHRLRDLHRPESVFQLAHPDLPADFPALKSLDNIRLPNNLPQQWTSFIGRENEMEEVKRLLAKTRLLTFAGSGGSGKTRLAVQVGAEALETYPDGVWLVELAPLTTPDLLVATVCEALGIREQPEQPIRQALFDHLKSKTLLLIFDNCEHLLSACAQLIAALLRSCPHNKVLATSREALGIGGEQTFRVPSLTAPDPKQQATPESVSRYEAVRLFIDRACFHKSDFTVTDANAPALAQLCHRLDGIPLAIELAAARIRSLPVEEITTRLSQRFRLLTGGNRAALPRQQTLRALIDWSYDLLTAQEKLLLCRLCVFVGGWTLAAAEQVGSGGNGTGAEIEDGEVFDLLTSLTDKSLVLTEEQDGAARYRFLETVRQYGRDRLVEGGESEAIRERHRNYFLALAEAASPRLLGAEQGECLKQLEAEHENLRAGLDWSLGEEHAAESLRLCAALQSFWWMRGHFTEGLAWCARTLEETEERGVARARTLNGAGNMAYSLGDYAAAQTYYTESLSIFRELGEQRGIASLLNNLGNLSQGQSDQARIYYEESLAIQREIGDKSGIGHVLNNLGNVAKDQGDYSAAQAYYEESLRIKREIGDRSGIALLLTNLGNAAKNQGDYTSARGYQEESVAIFRALGERRGMAMALNNLGSVSNGQGDYASAQTCYEESLAICKEIGERRGMAYALNNLGNRAFMRSDYVSAQAYQAESLILRREIGDRIDIAVSLEAYADLAARDSRASQAAVLWGAAEALRAQIGAPRPLNEQAEYQRNVALVRQTLEEKTFSADWAAGAAMTLDQAIDFAFQPPDSKGS